MTDANMTGESSGLMQTPRDGVKELLLYTPRQGNLLADMGTWAILEIADDLRRLL